MHSSQRRFGLRRHQFSAHRVLMVAFLVTIPGIHSGCLGPHALRVTRQDYNEVIHRTGNEQLLLNLVRLRYRDPPSFLELGSLSTQFAFDHSASLDGTIFHAGRAPGIMGIDGRAAVSERPTVTYAPLQGPEFVERLVSPMSLETIILVGRSGWSIDRVLRCTVQELNGLENARTASGPIPEVAPREYAEFQSVVRTLRQMQLEQQIEFGFETHVDPLSEILPTDLITGQDIVAAAQEGWLFQNVTTSTDIPMHLIQSDSEIPWGNLEPEFIDNLAVDIAQQGLIDPLRVRWDSQREKFILVEGFRSWAAIQTAVDALDRQRWLDEDRQWLQSLQELQQLGKVQLDRHAIPCEVIRDDALYLAGTEESLIVRYAPDHEPDLRRLSGSRTFRAGKHELPLSIEPRSLLGTMYYLSHAIEVPSEHAEEGLAMFTRYEWGEPFNWHQVTGDLLRVCWSKHRPKVAFVAVKYRDYWFYIDDRDHSSKATFTLVMQLFELQAGGGATGTKPVLTLSVGG